MRNSTTIRYDINETSFHDRCDAYNCILNALSHIFEKSLDHPHSLPTEPGPPVQPDVNALSVDQAKHLVSPFPSSKILFNYGFNYGGTAILY